MNGAAPVTASGVKPRRLVLHFDINKTIVMKDPSNNVNNSTLTVRLQFKNFYFRLAICLQTLSGVSLSLKRLTVLRSYNGPMSLINLLRSGQSSRTLRKKSCPIENTWTEFCQETTQIMRSRETLNLSISLALEILEPSLRDLSKR